METPPPASYGGSLGLFCPCGQFCPCCLTMAACNFWASGAVGAQGREQCLGLAHGRGFLHAQLWPTDAPSLIKQTHWLA